MCGIVGHVALPGTQPDIGAVEASSLLLRHRGPDGSGMAQFNQACLAHRRLSIIDVSESDQPWFSPDRRYCLVFNGEIYNYIELRKELEKEGFEFSSNGDTEVLLNMYIRYGVGCLEKFNGMFAFAIWDDVEKTLFIARDRIGKKPLYYANTHRGLVFASELSALNAFRFLNRAIDLEAVNDYFAYQYIPRTRSIYQSIQKLLPAHYMIYKEGHLDIKRYWRVPRPVETSKSLPDFAEELVTLVDDAVRLRLRSDVPLGAFLSGGIDSTIIVATMKRLGANIETFTVGFDELSYDERSLARATANYFGTSHHEREVTTDVALVIENCLSHFGEPFADPSAIPTWFLCEHTRQNATVALSGDGSDELFGGYKRYAAAQLIPYYRRLPQWSKQYVLKRLASRFGEGELYYGKNWPKKLKLFINMAEKLEESPTDLLSQTFTASERSRLLRDSGLNNREKDHIEEFELEGLMLSCQMMMCDINSYLSEDILTKVDRMSMAHSLEVRCPFLDYRLIEYASRLPLKYKMWWGRQKYILKYAYAQKIPNNVITAKKHGFSAPLGKWLRGSLKSLFEDAVLNSPMPGFLNREEVLTLWSEQQNSRKDNSFKLWSILSFCLWYKRHLSNQAM